MLDVFGERQLLSEARVEPILVEERLQTISPERAGA
jgi:hypothetical protein